MARMTKLLWLLLLILVGVLLAIPRAWASSTDAFKKDLIVQLDTLANAMKNSIRFRCELGLQKIEKLDKSKDAEICFDPNVGPEDPAYPKTVKGCEAFVIAVKSMSINDGYPPKREETVRNAERKNTAWLEKVAKSEHGARRFLFGVFVFGILDNVFKQKLNNVHETFLEQQKVLYYGCYQEYIDIEDDPTAYAMCCREAVERAFGKDRKKEVDDLFKQVASDVESKKTGTPRVNAVQKVDRHCPTERIVLDAVATIDRESKELKHMIEEYTDKDKTK